MQLHENVMPAWIYLNYCAEKTHKSSFALTTMMTMNASARLPYLVSIVSMRVLYCKVQVFKHYIFQMLQ